MDFIFWRQYKDTSYLVSSNGLVYSNKSKKILKPYISCGYKEVYIYKNGKRKYSQIF